MVDNGNGATDVSASPRFADGQLDHVVELPPCIHSSAADRNVATECATFDP
jgi:hypothetical protein